MAESSDEGLGLSTICPYLHSREDPATAYAFPALANRCYCPRGPKSLGVEHQANFCLGTGHKQCPYYLTQQEAWSRHINRTSGPVRGTFQDWRARLERGVWDIGVVLGERLPRASLGVEVTRTYVVGQGITKLMVAAVAILALLGGAAYMLEASPKGTVRSEIASASSMSTPTAPVLSVASPEAVIEWSPSDTSVATPTAEPTSTPLASPTDEATSTPFATATWPQPTASFPPGVYVTAISPQPAHTGRNQVVPFAITFTNTTGTVQSYSLVVQVFSQDTRKGFGETSLLPISVPTGTTVITSASNWAVRGPGGCVALYARAYFQNPDHSRWPFLLPDGSTPTAYFSVC